MVGLLPDPEHDQIQTTAAANMSMRGDLERSASQYADSGEELP